MLISINTYIVVMVLDSIRVQNFHYLTVAWVKMSLFFGVHMSYSLNIDNKGKDILILSKGPIQGWDDATLIAKAQYSISFSRSNRKFCLSLHYNGSNNFLFVNFLFATKINKFKAKVSEKKKKFLVFRKYFRKFFSQ